MAVRGWGVSVGTATGVAAAAGAAQLGLGYGLGVVAWLAPTDPAAANAWVQGLAWAVWAAATSTVIGALTAGRLAGAGTAARPVLVLASAVGALVTVVLLAVPARTADGASAAPAQTVVGGHALLGVLLGLVMAYWVLSSPAAARNVTGTVAWVWILAVVGVGFRTASGEQTVGGPLAHWQPSGTDRWFRDISYWPAATLALVAALLIGLLAARRAARQPTSRVGAAVSGAAGPLLVAVAYLSTTPPLSELPAEMRSAPLVAPWTVLAGIAGSALIAALAQRTEQRTESPAGRRVESPAEQWVAQTPSPVGRAVDRPGPADRLNQAGADEPQVPIRSNGSGATAAPDGESRTITSPDDAPQATPDPDEGPTDQPTGRPAIPRPRARRTKAAPKPKGTAADRPTDDRTDPSSTGSA